jgi:hypothetical protein
MCTELYYLHQGDNRDIGRPPAPILAMCKTIDHMDILSIPLPRRSGARRHHRLIRNTCGECSEGAGTHSKTPLLWSLIYVWGVPNMVFGRNNHQHPISAETRHSLLLADWSTP